GIGEGANGHHDGPCPNLAKGKEACQAKDVEHPKGAKKEPGQHKKRQVPPGFDLACGDCG
ncbi:MAG: hypothetical protein GY809_23745, partial [Planctomycetes bacterium]|nr:hypothetical protein [Planctomycetota bacterium]